MQVTSFDFDRLDPGTRWWFGEVLDHLGLAPDRFSLAVGIDPETGRRIRAARFRGADAYTLQRLLDRDAWTDRALAGGDETIELGRVRVRRGVAGERSYRLGGDGNPVADPAEIIDPTSIYYQVLRGDTWFDIFAAEDLDWAAAAASEIAGGLGLPGGGLTMELPEGWIGGPLAGTHSETLARAIDARLASFDDVTRARWSNAIEALRPGGLERPIPTGTRYAAYDLGSTGPDRGPTMLLVWECLPAFPAGDSSDDDATSTPEGAIAERRRVSLRSGPATVITMTWSEGGEVQVVEQWDLSAAGLDYQLLFMSLGVAVDTLRPIFEGMARSFQTAPR
jgi:hypothetical protein